jgi:hypothetical protein
VPLVIDWYEGQLHVAEFVRPHDRSEAEHRVWLDFIVRAAAEALGVDPDSQTYLKRRERQRGKSQYERQDDAGDMLEVHEGGHKFLVNLSDYLDTACSSITGKRGRWSKPRRRENGSSICSATRDRSRSMRRPAVRRAQRRSTCPTPTSTGLSRTCG